MLEKLKGPMSITLLQTFTARGIAAGGSFALVIVLGRLYGAEGVGIFALAQSLLMGIAMFCRYGMDNALMRFVGRDIQAPQVFAYLKYSCIKALLLSTGGSVALFLSRSLWSQFFNTPQLASVLVGIAVATPAFTMSFIFSGFMKAVRKPATGLLLQNGAVSIVAALLILLLQKVVLPTADFVNIGIAYAIGAWVLVFFAASLSWYWFHTHYQARSQRITVYQVEEFNRSATAFFANNVASFLITVVSFWIAGYFLAPSDVGLLKAAQQIATFIGIILLVINAVYPPRFSAAFHKKEWATLSRLAHESALLGLGLVIAPTLICLVFPSRILGLFGHDFYQAIVPLYILVIMQFINVACGPVGNLLNMTGNERLVRNVAWIGCSMGVVLMIILTPLMGVVGAALGIALSVAFINIMECIYIKERLNICMFLAPKNTSTNIFAKDKN